MHGQTKPITLKVNLYDYSLVAVITLCCFAYMVHCCNLVLIGTHICFVVNCKSSYAISTMIVGVACTKVITPYSNNFLSCPFTKVLVYRYLYECYLCFVLLCISNQKQPSCKKRCGHQKGYGEKRCEIQGGGQEMAVMVG